MKKEISKEAIYQQLKALIQNKGNHQKIPNGGIDLCFEFGKILVPDEKYALEKIANREWDKVKDCFWVSLNNKAILMELIIFLLKQSGETIRDGKGLINEGYARGYITLEDIEGITA
jgi:hypothetical protein